MPGDPLKDIHVDREGPLRDEGRRRLQEALASVSLLGGALLLAGAVAPGTCPAPRLDVSLSRTAAKQGAIVVVTLTSDVALSSASAELEGRASVLERGGSPKLFRGLVGVDFEGKTGPASLRDPDRGPLRRPAHRGAADRRPVGKLHGRDAEGRARLRRAARIRARTDPRGPGEGRPRVAERRRGAALERAVPAAGGRSVREKSFGSRRIFNGEPRSPHSGVDLAAHAGQDVDAPAPGRVALAEDLYFSGGTIILDHGGGLFTSYFHLSRIDAKVGDVVAAGDRHRRGRRHRAGDRSSPSLERSARRRADQPARAAAVTHMAVGASEIV